ncbi:S26 family signal peptidase [Spirilliplanes yamanashiensis]|uniref:Peptidase S26 domain-containing protein n=1 Tax=Spirilliplanes yamanashiensis TaxID=42233 RepID=A0A8J3YB71_9ACTN|nr:S26 family signal peptidase [Spirilliplanes yamanashiensis]MDP9819026.1 signal peptidase I [Spirilliplanes yamanashiensis]GIJ05481.1 hypothetical protein Sya03_48330 [Spirilliplanes yamanashiensis]
MTARHGNDARRTGDALAVPVDALRRLVLFTAAAALAGALLLVGVLSVVSVGPRLFGWQATTVRSDSMAPAVRTGDIVLTAPAGRIVAGDVVRFPDPARPGRHLLHRVAGVDGAGLVHTRGDANLTADSTPVPAAAVEGVARLRLPALGLPAVEAARHPGATAALGVLLTLAVAATARPARRRHRRRRGRRATAGIVAAGVTGLCAVLAAGAQTSSAAFVASSANPVSNWAAGTITISDDDGGGTPTTGTALFSVTGLTSAAPPASRCITVTYTGNAPAPVRLYTTALTGTGLGPYLNLTVETGTGGGFASCTGFTPSATLYNGTLGGYASAYPSYASGLSASWTPATNGAARVFRITYSLSSDPAAVGLTAGAALVWEAQA